MPCAPPWSSVRIPGPGWRPHAGFVGPPAPVCRIRLPRSEQGRLSTHRSSVTAGAAGLPVPSALPALPLPRKPLLARAMLQGALCTLLRPPASQRGRPWLTGCRILHPKGLPWTPWSRALQVRRLVPAIPPPGPPCPSASALSSRPDIFRFGDLCARGGTALLPDSPS